MARRAGQTAPAPDPRLDWVMTDIARQVRGNDQPSLEAVDFLLAHYGLPEPTPHVLLSQTSTGGESQIRERLRGEIAAMLRAGPSARVGVGVDRAGGMIYVALGLQERHLELRGPVARVLSMAGYQEIVTHLDSGYSAPALVITAPDGRVSEQSLARRDGAHIGDLRCLARGRHQVEITAAGPGGPGVLANFPIYCGMTPPDRAPGPAGSQPSSGRPEDVEQAVLTLIARDRARAGLAPVVSDPRLAAVARAHSQDMANHDFVSHVSPRSGSTMDRVRVGGLAPELLLENVGRAYSAEEAETGFLSSPGHRGNILDPRARRVGVGVAFGPPVTGTQPLYVTQLFTN